ncbi:Proteasome subunit beta type protein [Rutstroemia sp. NJR-2017a BBW]|nr:Proteasome subunit beta type protein [Rutstroemia sp. NJR-2017a BBW]
MVSAWKHVARIRSWRERDRTIAFASVYFLAWLVDFLVPVLITFVIVLIAWPPARSYCFPPAPVALIDSKTGGVKKPPAGVLGNETSLTGAPENHKGEAVEQEATNFVNSLTSIAITSAAGKHPRWERFANALSPTPPFPQEKPRLKLAACLVPLLLISMFTSSYMFMKMNGFFIGFGFFGDPLIWRGLSYLNREFPHWQKLLEIRNTLLKGVPTNAQLTITLLRIGEANKAPLPPPPSTTLPPPIDDHVIITEDMEHIGASDTEIASAVLPDGTETVAQPKPKKKGHRILAAFKSVTKGGVETVLGTDRLKAAAGVEDAKNRLGVLKKAGSDPLAGPIDFPCRYKGKKGHAYITATATSPALSWTTEKEDIDPVFSIAIADIKEIKKVGGLGWKTKLVVGWATSREIADGIIITDKEGNKKHLTAIALRDELFNRLISMGAQMWEAW